MSPHPERTPVGVAFTPFEGRLEVIDQVTAHAERRGLDFVSVAEAMSLAAPIVLARLAGRTQRIGLRTGVLSVWSRTPATIAMTAAELQRQSAGRFGLGLGASTPPVTEGFHGQTWEAPVERIRATGRPLARHVRHEDGAGLSPDPARHGYARELDELLQADVELQQPSFRPRRRGSRRTC